MKKFALTILFTLLTSPAWATSYFLAPASGGGNDSNNGLSASAPWLSPNHAVNCGDVITAAASASYLWSNFNGNWGTVTCPAGNNVAWLKCATFDACKITGGTEQFDHSMSLNKSYWGVQGFELTAGSGTDEFCFQVRPTSVSIHHIIFANNVCHDAGAGFTSYINGSLGADYLVIVGNIFYNAANSSDTCDSGISVNSPVNVDTVAGTHIYIVGNFSYQNVNPTNCNGGGTDDTDGEGIILDTISPNTSYSQQIVVANNILVGNGGRAIEVLRSNTGSPIYIYNNTTWDNQRASALTPDGSYAEIYAYQSYNMTLTKNLAVTNQSTGPQGFAYYAYGCNTCDSSDSIAGNDAYSASGNNYYAVSGSGFSSGTNTTMNPSYTSATLPGEPSCGSSTSVPNCMSAVISNFRPTAPGASAYGYQIPSTTVVSDPLFPQWVCNVNLPASLVTLGCTSSSSLPAPPTNISAVVK